MKTKLVKVTCQTKQVFSYDITTLNNELLDN